MKSSKLTVFSSREAIYESAEYARCLLEEKILPGNQKVSRYILPVADFDELKTFLNRADVKTIGPFMNAGPGVGDFKITFGAQTIDVISLMPTHMSLVEDPALIHLVCRAKAIARAAERSSETPDWCANLTPLSIEAPPN